MKSHIDVEKDKIVVTIGKTKFTLKENDVLIEGQEPVTLKTSGTIFLKTPEKVEEKPSLLERLPLPISMRTRKLPTA